MGKVSLVLIGFFFVLISGNLMDTGKTASIETASKIASDENMYMPGEIFYEDGWVGWIDPKLTDEPVPKPNKEKAAYKGSTVTEGGTTYISCPDAGTKCGRLYVVEETGIRFVGMYLDD